MTKTEAVLRAFVALLAADDTLPPVERNTVTFSRVAPFTVTLTDDADDVTCDVGVVLFDGSGMIDAERLATHDYEIEHTADLEIVVQGPGCDTVFDAILERVGTLVSDNQTGDDWDFLTLGVPQRDFAPSETHDEGKGCVLPVTFTFRSTQPF